MNALQPLPRMTVAQFAEWDDGTDTRYELVRGRPVAMAPPSGRHVRICGNIVASLVRQVRPPCVALFGGGTARADEDEEYRIPDVFVTCEPTPRSYFGRARLVVEVLSPSTERVDRSEKLDFYQSFQSVEAILLVWQDRRRVQLQLREQQSWRVFDLIAAGEVVLPGLDVRLGLDEIYAGIDLDQEPPAEAEA